MGLIADILNFARVNINGRDYSESTVNPGGGANITIVHYADPGDDSSPLPGDKVAGMPTQRSGSAIAVAYLDLKNLMKAQPGDKRIYSRDSAGNQVAEVWLKNNGDIIVDNGEGIFSVLADGTISGVNQNGSFALVPGGNFVVNGVTIDTGGNITTLGDVTANEVTASGVVLTTHIHSGVETGGGNTGGPV